MLTASAALLAGRRGRAVLHAAAAITPDGGAWMLVGDAWAGKSTTTATLVAARWDYLSDDQVVLGDATGGLALEGWPRTAHLDAGWRRGAPEGRRVDADLARLGGGRWRRAAPLAGILLPGVAPDEPTVLAPAPASRALEALLRQSPWLLADRDAAPGILALLTRAASLPAFSLRLGRDTFARPDALLAILTELPARGISAG